MGTRHNVAFGDFGMGEFFQKIEALGEQSEKLDSLVIKIKIDHEKSKTVTSFATKEEIVQRRKKHMNEVRHIVLVIKSKFLELNEENLTNRQKPECEKGSPVDQARTKYTFIMKKKLGRSISELLALIESICQEQRETFNRHYYTVMGTMVDKETMDRLIETGDIKKILKEAMWGKILPQVLEAYEDIKVYREIVREVDKKFLELQKVFEYAEEVNKAPKMESLQKNSGKSMCIII